jgi:hypothetical protein
MTSPEHRPSTTHRGAERIYVATLAAILLFLVAGGASSLTIAVNSAGCMQDIAGFNLQCTANDVQIASATDITILDDGCAYPGDTVDFEAVFEVVVTAKERYDIGLYFATDGDANNDGAVSGVCSVSTPDYQGDGFLDLDGTSDDPNGVLQDTCGDIDKDTNPLYPRI